jgi:PmbA protein
MDLQDLRERLAIALDMAHTDPAVAAAEVCISWCEQQTVRVQYDDERPDDAVQTPLTSTHFGVGITVITDARDGHRVGFGREHDDLSPDSIKQALEQAKASALPLPTWVTLPSATAARDEALTFHDPDVLLLAPDTLSEFANEALEGALATFREAGFVTHLRVCGHLHSRKEQLMVGNTHGLLAGETTTGLLATLLARLTQEQSQGTGNSAATHVADFAPYDAGVEAAQGALQGRGSVLLDPGDYPVIFAPPAIAALLEDLLLPALSLDTVTADANPLVAQFGQQVASPLLTLTDEGRLPRGLGSHVMTGEGLPTGTTPLIARGRLVGFLADAYHVQALGTRFPLVMPFNGMRYSTQGQSYAMLPGIFPTNVLLTTESPLPLDALLEPIAHGMYVGDLWHTSSQGERRHGDFISTVVGSSFHIQQGKLGPPLRPGTLHIQDNIRHLLHGITGLASQTQQAVLSTRQALVVTPAVRCQQVHFGA